MTIELRLLGTFEVEVDGRPVPDSAWRHRRAADVVKVLALEPTHRLHREQVMDALWPELRPEAAAANLRKAIHYARKALGFPTAISTNGGMVELGPATEVRVDCVAFAAAARTALGSGDLEMAAAAGELYAGELLPADRYEPWTAMPRERLRSLAIRTLKCASRWDEVVEIEPADEEAHRALMQQALDAGDRARAVRQFDTLSRRLRIDLGMGPDPSSLRLYERALAGGNDAATDARRVRTLLARAFVHLNNGELELAAQSAAQARQLALNRDLAGEFNEATALVSMVASLRGRWRDLFRADFAEAVKRPNTVAARVFDAHLCVTEYHVFGPDGHVGMLDYAAELRRIARASGSDQGAGVAELLAGESELFSGRVASAEKHLQAAIHLLGQAGANAARVLAIQRLAECAMVGNDEEGARRLLLDGLELARQSELAPHLVVRMHEGLVRLRGGPAAGAAIRAAQAELAALLYCVPCSVGFRLASATALAEVGDLASANEHLERADEVAAMWRGGAWHAALLEARGVLRRAGGAEVEARELFVEAAERFAELDRPMDEARCRFQATSGATSAPVPPKPKTAVVRPFMGNVPEPLAASSPRVRG